MGQRRPTLAHNPTNVILRLDRIPLEDVWKLKNWGATCLNVTAKRDVADGTDINVIAQARQMWESAIFIGGHLGYAN